MALRTNPTLRQLRLGAELRRMREQAGLGGSQLARALGINPAHVTQMESGRTGVSIERLRTIAALCMCVNEPLIDALAAIITDRDKGGWWEEYAGPSRATSLRSPRSKAIQAGSRPTRWPSSPGCSRQVDTRLPSSIEP